MSTYDEATAWLAEHWDPKLAVEDWWRLVAAEGWSAPHFPPEHGGRGLPVGSVRAVHAAFAAYGALRPPAGLGLMMAAPTITTHGSPEQIARYVPPILDGRAAWCQLFSEPGAGSDLAGLTTRAERDGDRWVINGQKVWSSMARQAEFGMLLARTDFNVPKHAGISWFALTLDQPGVEIRPLREMTGDAVFNEVFFDDAVCESGELIGGEGNGWAVAQTTLFHERIGIGGGLGGGFPTPGPKGGFVGTRAGDAATIAPPEGMVVGLRELIDLAHEVGRADDPVIRQQLALLTTYVTINDLNARRAKAEAASGGGAALARIGKLSHTRITKLAAEIGAELAGANAMLAGRDALDEGIFSAAYVFAPASSIYGGTDEIQKNVAAEKVLGLPREAHPDRDRPYGEVLRGRAGSA